MFQNKEVEICFQASYDLEERLDKIRSTMISHGVPSRFRMILKKNGFDDLEIGDEKDVLIADSVLIKW